MNATSAYTFSPSGPTVDESGVVTLAAGATYTFTETNAAGCISAASSNVVIDAEPATPSAPVAGAITQPSCAVATGSFTITSFDATSTYTFTPSATVDESGVVTLAAGATYTFTETNAAGCISAASSNVVIDAEPATPSAPVAGAITQPSCAVATGSFTITSFDATSTYTFTPSATVDESGVVTLAAGATYTFTETNAAGCESHASSDVVIDAQPSTPSAPVAGAITQPSCAVATGSFTITSFDATSTYTFSPSGPTVDAGSGVVTLAAGATYTFTETNAAGCESHASSDVVIDAEPATPSAPVAGAITQPSCAVATGSFTITSFDATSTYTFTPSATVDESGVVTLAAGATYTFTETNAAGCESHASSDVVIDAQPSTPSAPVAGAITQPSCAVATGSFTITSFDATSTYTFSPSGPTVDAGSGVVTLAAGATYTFTETNAAGCESHASSDVVIDAEPATPSAPVAGAITQPSCAVATGSFTITSFDATSTYTFTPSATVDESGVVTLAAGATYTFTETNAAGCESHASSDVVIDAQPSTPSAPVAGAITQPSCAVATGSFTITSFESTSTYTFSPSGPTVDAGSGVVTLAAGATYTFTETNAAGCESHASSDVVIDAAASSP